MTEWDGVVDIVIHAAGVMDFAPFEEIKQHNAHRKLIALSTKVPLDIIFRIAHGMQKNVNLSSVVSCK